ncbi:hypothetical protein WJX74_010546 [Apatococcus lobatus]|uniref:PLAC8 family protein n=1 Tax=Apatococcus lobatus TaxID=904363 RepID=A0AAW1S6W6_9CHLO
MGAVVDFTEESTALLATPPAQQFLSKQPSCAVEPPVAPRSWDGKLCECCGPQCSREGWGACALTYCLPCFAFGSNMKRAFRSSLWLQAILFFVLFYGVHQSLSVAMQVTSEQCRADLPVPEKPLHVKPMPVHPAAEADAHDTWLTGRKLLQIDDGPGKFEEAFADVLPSAAVAHAVVHGGAEEQVQSSFETVNAEVVDVVDSNTVDEQLQEIEEEVDVQGPPKPTSVSCLELGPLNACSEQHPAPPHPIVMPFTPDFQKVSPGCQKAFLGVAALYHLAIASFFIGVIYAARRRTLMRQKFLIPGSKCCDLWSWLCCPLCALCQETRTLRANNVRDGQWGGFPQPGLVVSAADWAEPALIKAPKVAEMQEV